MHAQLLKPLTLLLKLEFSLIDSLFLKNSDSLNPKAHTDKSKIVTDKTNRAKGNTRHCPAIAEANVKIEKAEMIEISAAVIRTGIACEMNK